MSKTLELSGQTFGRLTVLSRAGSNERGSAMWKSTCKCGGTVICTGNKLQSGNTTSCGCFMRERQRDANITHGMSRTPTGTSWNRMLYRCFNPNNPQRKDYAGRGITVCHGLRISPANLEIAIGPRPPSKTLDREDNDGSYTCGTCFQCTARGWTKNIRWATRTEQNQNRRRKSA